MHNGEINKMSRFIVLGGEEFTLGFKLSGLNDIYNITENTAEKEMKDIFDKKIEGILVTDNKTIGYLSERTRLRALDSVNPVVVVLSETSEQEELRRMIIKAIGVDIMEKD